MHSSAKAVRIGMLSYNQFVLYVVKTNKKNSKKFILFRDIFSAGK